MLAAVGANQQLTECTITRALARRATNPETTKRMISLLSRLPELEGPCLIIAATGTKTARGQGRAVKEAVDVGDKLRAEE